MIKHLKFNEPIHELDPELFRSFSTFYIFLEFIKRIVHEEVESIQTILFE